MRFTGNGYFTVGGFVTSKDFLRRAAAAVALGAIWLLTDTPARAQSLNGLWISDGYGLLLELPDDRLDVYEITSISCMHSWSARRRPMAASEQWSVFEGDRGLVRLSHPSPGIMRMRLEGTVSDLVFRPAGARPKPCALRAANTPQTNYAILWQTFHENYPFFELHRIDWRAVDRKFRPRVTVATKPGELFQVFQQMIEPLQDAHTGVVARDIHQEFHGWRPSPDHLDESQWEAAAKIITSKYLEGASASYCKGQIQFGSLKNSFGYLRITAFYGYVDTPSYSDRLQALESALDSIFESAPRWKGLVVDVRRNKGGDDALGLAVAARLTTSRYLAYKKAARKSDEGELSLTASQDVWVERSSRPGFHGRVVLLTGADTVSAGETFTLALKERIPRVIRNGLNTQGVFSDVLIRTLPNGWRFRLPNEIYFTSDAKSFDGAGVPPDVRISSFSLEEIQNGRDAGLEKAIQLLAD